MIKTLALSGKIVIKDNGGGGIHYFESKKATLIIKDCRIVNNEVNDYGGGLSVGSARGGSANVQLKGKVIITNNREKYHVFWVVKYGPSNVFCYTPMLYPQLEEGSNIGVDTNGNTGRTVTVWAPDTSDNRNQVRYFHSDDKFGVHLKCEDGKVRITI